MFYTVYKTTNLVNGKIYIGAHRTHHLDDDYMGSGVDIKKAIERYGLKNFKKEILFIFENEEQMFEKESELVNKDFIKETSNYNVVPGGGGWTIEVAKKGRKAADKVLKEKYGNEWRRILMEKAHEKAFTPAAIKKRTTTMFKKYGDDAFKTFSGKTHSETTKRKIGEANSKHQKGKGNSQYGTVWVTNINDKKSYRIMEEKLVDELRIDGVIKGRIINFDTYENKIQQKTKKNKLEIEKKELACKFLRIKKDNNFMSIRSLHEYLVEHELYSYSQESLRVFLKKFKELM